MVAEDAGSCVGGEEDGADVFDACGVGGHQLLPKSTLTRLQFDTINARWQFTGLINVNRVPVGAPDDRLFAGIQSFYHTRLTAVRVIKISLLVGTDAGNGLPIMCDHEI